MFLWNDYQESLDKKYDMFQVNRQYKNTSFKTPEDYLAVQTKLADEIEKLDGEIEEKLREIVNQVYPEVEVVDFDSKMNSSAQLVLGRLLVDGEVDDAKRLEIEAWILRSTAHKVHVDLMSDLDDEVKKLYSKSV